MHSLLHKKLLFCVVSFVLVFSSIGTAFGVQQAPSLDYLALGDSLAAGVTPYPPAGFPYFNIDKSYADLLAEKLEAEGVLGSYENYGFPLYTSELVLGLMGPTAGPPYPVFPPHPAYPVPNPSFYPYYTRDLQQVSGSAFIEAVEDAEIITLNAGANDVLPLLATSPGAIPDAIEQVGENIYGIVSRIKIVNPEAKIYVMGYYNAFPYDDPEEQDAKILILQGLNEAIDAAVAAVNLLGSSNPVYVDAEYVDVYDAMGKHLTKYLPEENIHPNVQGYRAMTKEFWDHVKVDFLKDLE